MKTRGFWFAVEYKDADRTISCSPLGLRHSLQQQQHNWTKTDKYEIYMPFTFPKYFSCNIEYKQRWHLIVGGNCKHICHTKLKSEVTNSFLTSLPLNVCSRRLHVQSKVFRITVIVMRLFWKLGCRQAHIWLIDEFNTNLTWVCVCTKSFNLNVELNLF